MLRRKTPEDIKYSFRWLNLEYLDTCEVKFECECSKKR